MQHSKHLSPMEAAIAQKKAKGVELKITIEPSDSKEAEKTTDLAPKGADHPSMMAHAGDQPPPEGSPMEESQESPHQELDEQMIQDMSDQEQSHLHQKDPRSMSLGERARFAALKRKK